MKLYTKIGIAGLVSGVALATAGGIICAFTLDSGDLDAFFGEPVSFEETPDYDFSELEVELTFLDAHICQGDEFRIVAENVPEKLVPELRHSGNKLEITQDDVFDLKDTKLNINNDNNTGIYTIYIPEKMLDKLEIDSSFCDLDVDYVDADKFDIDCSFGEYTVNSSDFGKAEVNVSFSDASVNNTEIGKLDFNGSFGSFEADSLRITEKGHFTNSFGDIQVNFEGDDYYFDKVNTVGSIDTFSCDDENVKLDVEVAFGNATFTN